MRDCPTLAKLLCIWLLPLPLQPIAETHAKPASHVLLSTAINLCLLTAHRSLLLSRSPGVCAGYFIEKSVEEAHAFLTRKMALIESQAQNVQAAARQAPKSAGNRRRDEQEDHGDAQRRRRRRRRRHLRVERSSRGSVESISSVPPYVEFEATSAQADVRFCVPGFARPFGRRASYRAGT